MREQSRTFFDLQAGFLGALLGWMCSEAFFSPSRWAPGNLPLPKLLLHDMLWGAIVALWLGMALALVDSVLDRSLQKAKRACLVGGLVGIAAGAVGVPLAEMYYRQLLQAAGPHLFARALGWGVIGAVIGTTQGITASSSRQLAQGALGGLIGGALGGTLFEAIAPTLTGQVFGRGAGLCAMGVCVGLSIGLAQEILKQNWLIALNGPSEGRVYILNKDVISFGRDELNEIPIFDEPSIARQHAQIRLQNNQCEIVDLSQTGNVLVNGQRVNSAILKDGTLLQIGQRRFLLRSKPTMQPVPLTPPLPTLAPPVTVPPGTCEFCGQQKDPATGLCACSPPGATAAEPATTLPQPTSTTTDSTPPDRCPYCGEAFDPLTGQCSCSPVSPGVSEVSAPPQEERIAPRLVGIQGAAAGKIYPLNSPVVSIGRHSNNNFVLKDDLAVSRWHAQIVQEPEGLALCDLNSSNGTFVNGQPISRHLLEPGDIILMGRSSFCFEGGKTKDES